MPSLSKLGACILLSAACLTIMVGCVIVPGLPSIANKLGVPEAASWLVTTPSLGVVIFGPFVGKLTERIGLYKTLCFGLFSYGLLGAGGMFLHGIIPVFADRLLLGGAAAAVMSAGTGLISVFYEGKARLAMIAKQGMSIELGGVVFLALGGMLASQQWNWPFMLYLFSWLLLVFVWLCIKDPKSVFELDINAQINRTIPKGLMVVYATGVFSMIAFFTGVIMLPLQLHKMGVAEAETGYFLSFVSLVAVVAAAVMPKIAKYFRELGTLCLAFTSYASAHLLFAFADTYILYFFGGVYLGVGFGLSVPLLNHMTIEQSHVSVRGRNLAYLSMAIFSGQFFSSFMEFIPGDKTLIFSVAAAFAFVVSLGLWPLHLKVIKVGYL